MPVIDPTIRFWISFVVTVAIAVSQGTLVLTGAVPAGWIPIVTAWCGIFATLGSAFLTALNGSAMTTASRVSSAANDPSVKKIEVTPAAAAALDHDKVVPTK